MTRDLEDLGCLLDKVSMAFIDGQNLHRWVEGKRINTSADDLRPGHGLEVD